MNITLGRAGFTVTRDLSSPKLDTAAVSFVQSVAAAMRKFRKMGRDDAYAGKVFSSDEIYRRLKARFTDTEPLTARAIARVLSNCYTDGVKEGVGRRELFHTCPKNSRRL